MVRRKANRRSGYALAFVLLLMPLFLAVAAYLFYEATAFASFARRAEMRKRLIYAAQTGISGGETWLAAAFSSGSLPVKSAEGKGEAFIAVAANGEIAGGVVAPYNDVDLRVDVFDLDYRARDPGAEQIAAPMMQGTQSYLLRATANAVGDAAGKVVLEELVRFEEADGVMRIKRIFFRYR